MANLFRQAWTEAGIPAMLANLGDPILYTPAVGAPVTITALWQSGDVVEQSEPGIAAKATVRLSDLALSPVDGGDTITFAGKAYKVVRIDRDEYGMATLSLRFVASA